MRMLEDEGFTGGDYIDIFDGGPTMSVKTDEIRTIRQSRELKVAEISDVDHGPRMMVGKGQLFDFRSGYARVRADQDDQAVIDPEGAASLELEVGDSFLAIGR
jgi:arginine N-succinyltransferase